MKVTLITVLSIAALALSACTKKEETASSTTTTATTTTDSAATTTAPAGDLKIEDTKVGTGALATAGKRLTVHYTGTLQDGKVFDTSRAEGRTPFQFTLGQGSVIQGWEKGFDGMKVGGTRKLTIPPHLGYGDRPAGEIPPNSTLLFDVELLKVE